MSKFIAQFSVIAILIVGFSIKSNAQDNYLSFPVRIALSDTSLDVVFDELSKQCACYFSYNANLIDGKQKVSLTVNDVSLVQALDSLFKEQFKYEVFKNQVIVLEKKDTLKVTTQIKPSFFITIAGTIVDSINHEPIPYASIALIGEYVGTVSNENGEFSLKIPVEQKNARVAVSSLGYENYTFSALHNSDTIRLYPAVISIQEVLVRSVGPMVLLRKARKKFKQNYRNDPYLYTAFYRESTRKNKKYLSYAEAFLNAKKYGINSGRDDKMTLIKSRNFKNIDPVDTILVKLQGGIDACIRLDLIRNLPDFIDTDCEKLYNYQLRDIRVWENQLVNVLAFNPKHEVMNALFEGELYIGVDDMAILGADFGYAPQRMSLIKKSLVLRKSNKIKVKPIRTNYYLKYSQHNTKYYIQHIRGEMDLKAKRRKQVRYANFHTSLEMVVTSIDTINVTTPERKNLMKTHSIFSEQVQLTPNDFWEKDNVILPEANIIKAFRQSGFKLEEKK